MKKYLKEIKEEAALCRKYIDECNISAPKSEHEKLALKVASGCEQTLKALMGEIEKDRWISVEEAMPEEHDSIFAKFKGTDKWCDSFWEKRSNTVLVVLTNNYDEKKFVIGTGYTIDGQWRTIPIPIQDRACVVYWMPFPKFDPKEEMKNSKEL